MLLLVNDPSFWASPSAVTLADDAGDVLDQLPDDIRALRQVSCNLVFHYWAGGDFDENGVDRRRVVEIDSRYADVMFDRLWTLGGRSLTAPRSPAQRVVGCCRDFTVLYVAMARRKGVPARARVGFATYFFDGLFADHVVAEVWDGDERRWRLVEPQVSDEFARAAGFDPTDVPPTAFLTGGRAWLRARAGLVDPGRFLVSPELEVPETRGWRSLRGHVIHDLASLTKHEMVLWDAWGLMNQPGPPDPDEQRVLDDVARLTSAADPDPEALLSWGRREGFAVPMTVTSHSPAHQAPLAVDVSRVVQPTGPGA